LRRVVLAAHEIDEVAARQEPVVVAVKPLEEVCVVHGQAGVVLRKLQGPLALPLCHEGVELASGEEAVVVAIKSLKSSPHVKI